MYLFCELTVVVDCCLLIFEVQVIGYLEHSGEVLAFVLGVEQQNSFKVNGKTYDVCVSGRPDIITVKDEWVIVEDIKTGKRKNSHKMQVLLYMLLLPLAPETQDICHKQIPHGRLIYSDGIVDIPAWKIDDKFRQRLREAIATITSSKSLKPKPSPWECRYCSLSHKHCQAKMAILT
ncbi:MAG: PD-(D/E)XK nuclease family protein [Cyanobacteriota bacterium]|nr:PD-(D/E)XK nuclease family protein [Cyanobacteriota bacterium]